VQLVLLTLSVVLVPLLCYALAQAIVALLRALIPLLVKIQFVGPTLAGWVDAMARAISRACHSIFTGLDHAIGYLFHQSARLVDWSYKEFRTHAMLILGWATFVTPIGILLHELRGLVHKLLAGHTHSDARLKRLEKEYKGIEAGLKRVERELHGIDETGVLRQVKQLEREVGRVESQTIPAINTRVGGIAGDLTDFEQYVKDNFLTKTAVDAETVVIAGLAALGLSGLRCNSNPFRNNPNACGLWGDLSSLLGLFAALGFAYDLAGIVRFMEAVIGDVEGLVKKAA